MSNDDNTFWCGACVGSFIIAIPLFVVMYTSNPIRWWHSEAIKHHAAHWQVDDSGNTTFHWNDEVTK